jgi:hypothetical protein
VSVFSTQETSRHGSLNARKSLLPIQKGLTLALFAAVRSNCMIWLTIDGLRLHLRDYIFGALDGRQ